MQPEDFSSLASEHGDFYGFESLLTGEEKEAFLAVREWLETRLRPVAVQNWVDATFPSELIEEFAELDIISPVRRKGWSNVFAGLVHAELNRVDASFATFLGVHDGLFTGTIEALASEEQKAEWLPAIYAFREIGAFGLTEPLAGSDVAGGLQTTARREGDSWVLNGAKRWIGNATWSDWVVIFAKDADEGGVKAFLVDTSSEGYSAQKIENKISLRTVQNADIQLKDVVVPESRRLANCSTFKDVNKVLRVTRLAVAWQAVGLQRAAFDLARSYAVERTQFGRPLASFQMIQEQLVQMLGNLTASTAMMMRLSQIEDEGVAKDEQSALAKAFTTARMRETVAMGRSIFGGNGIVADYEIAKVFADAEAIYTFEGTHEVNTLVTGRAITGVSAIV
ncbi:acyl-CoA dehydrogenase family protein [Falsarthrobacter nasiphocae]|uniref:Glutaryl-CoA dehydrogenase n=1 Tax=Falsarthrobacter nasiphocae TaxID=189863 RepID=A0AAE3YIL9_9MICC|nr:acyl-CoA dehydrogenase family protein [Falsarthrobacter nasiphocae]MDR6892633.1 glutaryl-CoA dehydrogenase [Falsarthrobacter nasiphocae]